MLKTGSRGWLATAKKQGIATGSRGWLATASHQMLNMCQACQKLQRHASWSTTGQIVQTGCSITSRLSQATSPSHQPTLFWKTWLFTFHSHSSINTPYTHEMWRTSRENIERETLAKTRLTHPQSSHRDSSNSSTLILSIVTSLKGSLPKPFLTIPTSVRMPFDA